MLAALAEVGIRVNKQGEVKTTCPRCSHTRKNPKDLCLAVNTTEGVWVCHHCGWTGSVKTKHSPRKREYIKPALNPAHLSEKWLDWFKSRAISQSTLQRFGVTQSDEFSVSAGGPVSTVNFNYYRDQKLVNIKYRGPEKRFKMAKDAELILYGMDGCMDRDYVVICEGEIDALSLYEAGIESVVSVPNGASLGSNKLEYIDNCWQLFEGKTKIYLATDADVAGKNLMEQLAARLGKDRCLIVDFPQGCKDANEVLMNYDAHILNKCITDARLYPIEGIHTVEDLEDRFNNLYLNGTDKGLRIGYNTFDELISWKRGEFTLVTGVPGCFTESQPIITDAGIKPISEINVGDKVLSYNHLTKNNEYQKVLATPVHPKTPDRLIEITMKDGTVIKVTENHEFFSNGKYIKIKDLLGL